MLEQKPWFKFYPEGVPPKIDYPKIPLFGLLEKLLKNILKMLLLSLRGLKLPIKSLKSLWIGLHQLYMV